ncbi:hypothetical protein GLYMA_18G123666v4 [Glycine max]|nr:hypothetical protein GLYMA_18G123666v4 [Glycine max]KAH1154250.1 hypothetical protein GYH30_049769 [Glycine max]
MGMRSYGILWIIISNLPQVAEAAEIAEKSHVKMNNFQQC